jgi:hypothetical protein
MILMPSVMVDGEVAGWIAEICLHGAQAVVENARRDGVRFPTEEIRSNVEDLQAVGRAWTRACAGANAVDLVTRTTVADANGASPSAERPALWSVCDVAGHLKISEAQVRNLAAAGALPAQKVGTSWIFFQNEVRECRR